MKNDKRLTPSQPPHQETSQKQITPYQEEVELSKAYSAYDVEDDKPSSDFDLKELWTTVAQYKYLILTITVAIFLLALYQTLSITPTYQAIGVLQIEDESSDRVLKYDINSQSNRRDFFRFGFRSNLRILKSKTLARQVIDELGLENRRTEEVKLAKPFFSNTLDDIKEKLSKLGFSYTKLDQGNNKKKRPYEKTFLSKLKVKAVPKSNVVQIKYVGEKPEQTALIVNTLMQKFIYMNLNRRSDSASHAKTFLQEQLVQSRSRLQESEAKLLKYTKDKGLFIIKDSKTGDTNTQPLTAQFLSELNEAIAEAERERIGIESKLALSANENIAIAEQGNEVIHRLKQSRAELQAEYQEKLSTYKPQYPLMLQLRQQIQEINKAINKEVEQSNNAVKGLYNAAIKKEKMLKAKYAKKKAEFLNVRDSSLQYNALKREVDTNRDMYSGLLKRAKEVDVAGNTGKNNISIIDKASVPYIKHAPNVKKRLIIGLLIGLFLGVILAFLLKYLDDTVRHPDELEKLLRIPVLGILPFMRNHKRTNDRTPLINGGDVDTSTPMMEAVRTLQTKLSFSTQEGMPKSLLITSASPSEGKTTLSIDLAMNIALAGKSVLLIDCDLRKPNIHKRLGLENNIGMSNYLTRQSDEQEATTVTALEQLFVITSGPLPPNPINLLTSDRMEDLLAKASERFDHIIIDAPPVMGLSDALVLSNLVSATLFVVATGQAKKNTIKHAFRNLQQSQANIIGGIVSKMKKRAGNSYGDDYYYYYPSSQIESSTLKIEGQEKAS